MSWLRERLSDSQDVHCPYVYFTVSTGFCQFFTTRLLSHPRQAMLSPRWAETSGILKFWVCTVTAGEVRDGKLKQARTTSFPSFPLGTSYYLSLHTKYSLQLLLRNTKSTNQKMSGQRTCERERERVLVVATAGGRGKKDKRRNTRQVYLTYTIN